MILALKPAHTRQEDSHFTQRGDDDCPAAGVRILGCLGVAAEEPAFSLRVRGGEGYSHLAFLGYAVNSSSVNMTTFQATLIQMACICICEFTLTEAVLGLTGSSAVL